MSENKPLKSKSFVITCYFSDSRNTAASAQVIKNSIQLKPLANAARQTSQPIIKIPHFRFNSCQKITSPLNTKGQGAGPFPPANEAACKLKEMRTPIRHR